MAVVYARQSLSVAWSGGKTFIKKDQPWDAGAGLVRERPELFSDEPTKVAGRVRGRGRPPVIERATRAPGEVREAVAREPEPEPEPKVEESEQPKQPAKKPGRPKLPRDADGNIIRD